MAFNHNQELVRANQQVAYLYNQGRYHDAIPIAQQAVQLTRDLFGEKHAEYATSLNNLATLYNMVNDYPAAIPKYQQALEVNRETLGDKHPEYAINLGNLAVLYDKMGDVKSAELLYNQALDILRITIGEQDPIYISNLKNLAELYKSTGNYSAAVLLYKQLLDNTRQSLGENHPDYADHLNDLAVLYEAMGNYAAAEPLDQQSLEIKRRTLGEEHPSYAASVNNLATLYFAIGNYSDAELFFTQALELKRKVRGEQHLDYAISLDNLAVLYKTMGNYSQAEPLYEQALAIRRSALGENHPDYAISLNNLAELHRAKGDFSSAEPLLWRALEIRRKELGEQHPDFATSLFNFASLNVEMGNYAKAKAFHQQALEIRCKELGEQHPDYADSLSSLAGIYSEIGDYITAEPLLQQALTIRREVLGEHHPDYANSLNNLAYLYHQLGKYAAAEPLYLQALEVKQESLGEQHPGYATSLVNLGALYRNMGNYSAAEPSLQKALEIDRQILGEEHPHLVHILYNLALLYVATDRQEEGLTLIKQAAAIDDRMIGQIFSIGSESQRMAYLDSIQGRFDIFVSLVHKYFANSSDEITAAFELILRRKAIGAEVLAAQRDVVMGGQYPELAPKLNQLTNLRMQIAQKTLAGSGREDLQTHQQLLTEWNAKKDRLEAELAREIPEMNLERKLRAVDHALLVQAIPDQTALVEFVRFQDYEFKAIPARGESQRKSSRYLAFTVSSSKPKGMSMIDLGEAETIDRLIAQLRTYITHSDTENSRGLGLLPVDTRQSEFQAMGIELRKAIFDPILRSLENCKYLMLAPDGDLSRLPFEVLPTGQGRYLIDDYQISYLSTGRDLLRFGAETTIQPGEPLLVADPDFDLCSGDSRKSILTTPPKSRDLRQANLRFEKLPATRVEGERIANMLHISPWLEGDALEARLKTCRSPYILHLATHGFFLENQKENLQQDLRGLGAVGLMSEGESRRLSAAGLENPLLRSGLALSGANTWLENGTPPEDAEDGILTAEDVTGLDLLATELVVLSACETGLGEIQTGEGVFGLRRAFVLAGAKTMVMSLWKVPDKETQELMVEFYRRILQGQSRAESLREAQLTVRKNHPDPLYWGAFICQGDPGSVKRFELISSLAN